MYVCSIFCDYRASKRDIDENNHPNTNPIEAIFCYSMPGHRYLVVLKQHELHEIKLSYMRCKEAYNSDPIAKS